MRSLRAALLDAATGLFTARGFLSDMMMPADPPQAVAARLATGFFAVAPVSIE